MTPSDWVSIFERVGLPLGLLLVILWTGSREVWVWGREKRELREDRDRYRDMALKGVTAAEKGANTAERIAEDAHVAARVLQGAREAQIAAMALEMLRKEQKGDG